MTPLSATDALNLAGVVVGLVVGCGTLLGGFWWLAKPRFMEWLRTEVLRPVQETHKQVTENHHSNEQPTVLDMLADLRDDVRAVDKRLDDHLLQAVKDDISMWQAIEAIAKSTPPLEEK